MHILWSKEQKKIKSNILQNNGFIFDALWPQDWNELKKYNIKFVSHVGVWKI